MLLDYPEALFMKHALGSFARGLAQQMGVNRWLRTRQVAALERVVTALAYS